MPDATDCLCVVLQDVWWKPCLRRRELPSLCCVPCLRRCCRGDALDEVCVLQAARCVYPWEGVCGTGLQCLESLIPCKQGRRLAVEVQSSSVGAQRCHTAELPVPLAACPSPSQPSARGNREGSGQGIRASKQQGHGKHRGENLRWLGGICFAPRHQVSGIFPKGRSRACIFFLFCF